MKKKIKSDDIPPIEIKNMTPFEMARWIALAEAVDIIADKAEDRKLDVTQVDFKPLAILKYVEGTCDSICKHVENVENGLEKDLS